jgi:hypothetical protein
LFEKVIHIINLFRPKFYNKLTWAVVGTGLFLLVQPLWEVVVLSLVNKYFQVSINLENNEYIGLTLVIFALIYHLATTSIYEHAGAINKKIITDEANSVKSNSIMHDVNLYNKISESFNKVCLNQYLSDVQNDHSYTSSVKNSISSIIYLVDEVDYDFLNETVNSNFINLAKALNELMLWCACEFEPYPPRMSVEDQRYCMHPYLNGDRSGDYDSDSGNKYREYAKELDNKVEVVRDAYKLFRLSVKRELYI